MSSILITRVSFQKNIFKNISKNNYNRFSSSINHNNSVGGTIHEENMNKRNEGTLQYQNTLPKQPIPPLEDVMKHYLNRSLPYLSNDQKIKTKESIELFLKKDGPILHQKLLDYDNNMV